MEFSFDPTFSSSIFLSICVFRSVAISTIMPTSNLTSSWAAASPDFRPSPVTMLLLLLRPLHPISRYQKQPHSFHSGTVSVQKTWIHEWEVEIVLLLRFPASLEQQAWRLSNSVVSALVSRLANSRNNECPSCSFSCQGRLPSPILLQPRCCCQWQRRRPAAEWKWGQQPTAWFHYTDAAAACNAAAAAVVSMISQGRDYDDNAYTMEGQETLAAGSSLFVFLPVYAA
jgi:hypothetical protein